MTPPPADLQPQSLRVSQRSGVLYRTAATGVYVYIGWKYEGRIRTWLVAADSIHIE